MIIAIDGPAGAGKGTLADRLAQHLGYAKLDTGLLYRAVGMKALGMKALRGGGNLDDEALATQYARDLQAGDLEDVSSLRSDESGNAASRIAAFPGVRAALLDFQRSFAAHPPNGAPGAILDGRDIGTVVCPDADVKLFVTAPLEVRAERRLKELLARGRESIYADVFEDMKARDERDQQRSVAPLAQAQDACLLDTADMDAEGVFAEALRYITSKTKTGQSENTETALLLVQDHRNQPVGQKIPMERTTVMTAVKQVAGDEAAPVITENFAELLDESFGDGLEGRVVKGTVIALTNDAATVDVGLKSEGRVPLKEFGADVTLAIGDSVDIYVERYEDREGLIKLSRERARREEAWTDLEKSYNDGVRVTGTIFGRVKGGFIVDLAGAVAFLPGSQVDIRPVRDVAPLMGNPQPFQILKMDAQRNNIVVSRRAVLEETRSEARSELISNLTEGQILEGMVKNITDYGAFVDLGGVDGLLHVTDIAWRRINHPSEALQIGETIKVQVIRFNVETQRISLGMKQLETDPWDGVGSKYPVGAKLEGRVTNITDYGAFVELEAGIEGLVHVSEMSWTKKNIHPGKIVSTSQEVEVMVLDVDPEKRRISLGLKQCSDNPWDSFLATHPSGTELEGEVKNITEFGLFIGLTGDIDGMIHLSDLSWDTTGEEAIAAFSKGDMVKAKVLDVDVEKERISLGIKQLTDDTVSEALSGIKKGEVVTCEVTAVATGGIEVRVNGDIPGFIRKSDLSRERSEQHPDRFAKGEKVDAKVTQADTKNRKLTLSIKALEVEDEKKAMAEFGSSNSGASLGDILGAALKQKQEKTPTADSEEASGEEAETVEKEAKTKKTAKTAKVAKPAKAKKAAKKADAKEKDAVDESSETSKASETPETSGDDQV